MPKLSVMLILEGTYPYNGGGVSTWAHILCNQIQNSDFALYSMNANYESKTRFELSSNVKHNIQLPLWTPDEPNDYQSYGTEYYKIVGKKEWTNSDIVNSKFIPIFKKLLHFIHQDSNQNIAILDRIIYDLWLYFENYDYKKTLQHYLVWRTYCSIIAQYSKSDNNPEASLYDLTIGMRWIYRFFIPLSVSNVPNVDVSHLTLSGFTLIPALIAQYKYGSAIMLTEHGVYIRERLLAINSSGYPYFLKNLLIKLSENIARLVYYKANAIVSVNKFNSKWEKMYGATENKIHVVYNGIDPDKFKPRPKPDHLKNIPTVVAAARIFALKDILTMIKSCAVVRDKIPNVQYLIYGDNKTVPEYTKKCTNLIAELQLENNFKLLGSKPNPHLFFCEGDISILTSISEGFPYTVIESMSCGIPVVATDVGGVSEALNSDCGILCKPKDAQQIGESVIKLLKNNDLRQSMSKKARERVLNEFTVDKFINGYEKIYEQVAKQKSEPYIPNKVNTVVNEDVA